MQKTFWGTRLRPCLGVDICGSFKAGGAGAWHKAIWPHSSCRCPGHTRCRRNSRLCINPTRPTTLTYALGQRKYREFRSPGWVFSPLRKHRSKEVSSWWEKY